MSAVALDTESPPQSLSLWRTALFGVQHVLVMYAGCVTVPLVFGEALGLAKSTIAVLVNADLLVAGVITVVQAAGLGRLLGARMPVVVGASFTALTPMILIGQEYGLSAVYGAMIAAGLFGILVAVPFSRLIRFFPPVVRGAAVTMIGLSLIGNSVTMIFGDRPAGGSRLALAAGIVLLVVALMRYGRGLPAQSAVLIALLLGTGVAALLSMTDFAGVGAAGWFGVPRLFLFGAPTFPIAGIISMCLVMLVIFTETTAYLLAVSETTGEPVGPARLARGLAADGLSALLAGPLTSFPDTVFAQNVSLVRMTGVTSRRVVGVAGGLLVALGLMPKMGEIVASLPDVVIGSVSLVMFATVAGVGIATVSKVDFAVGGNLLIVSLAMGIGMIPIVSPDVYSGLPSAAKIIFGGAVTSTVVVAFVLNLVFHHLTPLSRRSTPA
ncbi:nucleobase:cation symporter-2 family protein [Nocardia blacklockiae]|uniref:nucleobase:cation symporter-2 family protein n=1 Tax=Nocardia blacklockiae TaxID=480036 RepID=UPI00189598F3|nr:nucleobase:cation symporter-2 family protein [Nocardia blacklockiae]MBF6172052.1 purine permease [Nocardia blacklockiae]